MKQSILMTFIVTIIIGLAPTYFGIIKFVKFIIEKKARINITSFQRIK
jgi:hypothetical protein